MSNRPSIPAEITREILIECGHRCAVCGAGCPLERAHIIPWRKSREHKAEDLICLCANCHQRADLEKWSEKTLREYKRRPWVLRQYENADSMPGPTTRVELTIEMELEHFNGKNQRWLQHAIAGFLEIPPNAVRITSMEKGSVKVTIELPAQSAERLLNAYKRNDSELVKYLAPLVLLDLRREEAERERILLKYRAGDRARGKVTDVKNYGAFVGLVPGVMGFVHKSEMMWGYVSDARNVVSIGDEVDVLILDVDLEKRRLSFSMKMPENDPLLKYHEADRARGRVTRIEDFGAFVELEPGVSGLVHISEISWDYVDDVYEEVEVGDEVDVLILSVDLDRRQLSLSMKQV